MIQVTYQKRNGCIIQRLRNTYPTYQIGEETSMGWKVLNIEYEYNNNYYSEYEYNRLIYKNRQRHIKQNKIKKLFLKNLKTLLYYIIWLLIINLIKI